MRKVLIVDDEMHIREGIKCMLQRYKSDYYEIQVCSNGLEAKELLRADKFDIVITDIKMPKLDGLKLINFINDKELDTGVIILSGYDEFEYALQGIKCGVKDYLLKPVIRDQLYKSVDKIDFEIKQREETADRLKISDKYEQQKIVTKLNYIIQHNRINEYDIKDITNNSFFDVLNSYYVSIFLINDLDNNLNNVYYNKLKLRLDEELKSTKYKNFSFFSFNGELVIICENLNSISKIYNEIKSKEISCDASLSNIHKGIENLKQAYEEAYEALEYRIFYNDSIIFYDNIKEKINTYNVDYDKINNLVLILGTNKINEISNSIFELFREELINKYSIQYFKETTKYLYMSLCKSLHKITTNKEEIEEDIKKIEDIYLYRNMNEYLIELISVIKKLDAAIDNVAGKNADIQINRAIEYINKNYSKDINLAVIANEANLNYTYFCELFKSYTGKNFVNYLKKIRVNKAKELLTASDYKIYEIGKLVGYNDSKQFTKVFKSITGITPLEYKNSIDN